MPFLCAILWQISALAYQLNFGFPMDEACLFSSQIEERFNYVATIYYIRTRNDLTNATIASVRTAATLFFSSRNT